MSRRPALLRTYAVAVAACAVIWWAPARAQAVGESGLEPAAIVMEVHLRSNEGSKGGEYRELLSRELLKHGKFALMDKDDVMRRVMSVMVTPMKRVTNDRLQEIEKMVARGDKLLYTDPREAVDVLHEAKRQLVDIMETISLNAQLRDELFKTQMLLARSHLDNGNEKRVRDVLREVILEFGDGVEVTEDNYHPTLVRLFRETLKSMATQRTASLRVESDPPGSEVFLNGQPQKALTPATYEGLYPGTYHVLVRKDQMESMVRKVVLEAQGTASLEVDVAYESALDFNKDSFGLRFDDVQDMDARLADHASRIGAFLELDAVILCGVIDRGSGPHLATFHVDVRTKALVRSRELVVKPSVVSVRRAEEMAAFLSGVEQKPEGVVTDGAPPPAGAVWYENGAAWALTGVGVAGIVVGAIFTVDWADKADQVAQGPRPGFGLAAAQAAQSDGETSGIIGAVGLGVGGAALATGVVLFVLDATSSPQPDTQATPIVSAAPVPLPGGGGFSMGLTF